MFKTKKHTKALLILSLCLLGSVGTLYAYFKVSDTLTNKFTFGNNTIEIIEEFEVPQDPQPGSSFTKKPTVKNTGTVPCYVRMLVEFSDNRAADDSRIDFNTMDWTEKQTDGYYYYKNVLTVGATTKPLFTTVTFDSDANVDDIQDFDIIVYAESVQSENHSSPTEAFENYIPSNE